jgi:hypothetical protein
MRSEGPLVVRQIEPMVDPALFARVQEQLHASLQNS